MVRFLLKFVPTWSTVGYVFRFLVINLGIGLLPFIFSWGIRNAVKSSAPDANYSPWVYTPEVAAFAIVLSATTLNDMFEEHNRINKTLARSMFVGLFSGVVLIAAIFGVFQFYSIVVIDNGSVLEKAGDDFRDVMFTYEVWVAIILLATCIVAEFAIGAIRSSPEPVITVTAPQKEN